MRNVIVLGLMLVLSIVSCQKEQEENKEKVDEQALSSEYLPLNVGNYWVYEYFKIDSMGIETPMNQVDSIIIVKDTIINGETFYIKEGNTYLGGTWTRLGIIRDSSTYLIDHTGKILFSESNFLDTLSIHCELGGLDTVYTATYKMEEISGNINYPAGNFTDVLDFRGTVITFIDIPEDVPNPRYLQRYFAPNVGEISYTNFWLSSHNRMIRKLVNYHIE